jgi:hypothetical protein
MGTYDENRSYRQTGDRSVRYLGISLLFILIITASCKKEPAAVKSRSYRMGFMISAPRADFNLFLTTLQIWTQRADAAIISAEVPWDSLLNGESPESYVTINYQTLAGYYRSLNYPLWVYIDPENGLERRTDADALIVRGKSIARADMQQLYIRFCMAVDSMLKPDHLGLALETNLIRFGAPDSIYQGVRKASNAAAQAIAQKDPQVKLSVSIQAEVAWGYLTGTAWNGIEKDLQDFPFIRELGISSYPYFNIASPALLPDNYYAKLQEQSGLPVFISEGGWTSENITDGNGHLILSDPQVQAAYISKQNKLLEAAHAEALFQLTFTDIDIASLPPSTPANLQFFAHIGLADIYLHAKPALNTWDSLFKINLVP